MSTLRMDDRGILTSCPSCGRTNRLVFEHLHQPERCGACKSPLVAADTPVTIDDERTFEALRSKASVPVVIDFWAPWCGPCRMVAPELEKVARAMRGRALVVKVNTDELATIGGRFQVQSIPTLAVLVDGEEAGRLSGARPAADIQRFVEQTAGRSSGR